MVVDPGRSTFRPAVTSSRLRVELLTTGPLEDSARRRSPGCLSFSRAVSSVGQSASLTPRVSGVRVPHRPPAPQVRSGTCNRAAQRLRAGAAAYAMAIARGPVYLARAARGGEHGGLRRGTRGCGSGLGQAPAEMTETGIRGVGRAPPADHSARAPAARLGERRPGGRRRARTRARARGSSARARRATLAAAASAPIAGFSDTVVWNMAEGSPIAGPTVVRFAPDGRVFVAEKRGRIIVAPSLDRAAAVRPRHPHPGEQLLGPRAARHGARPGLRVERQPLRRVHLRPHPRRSRARAAAGSTAARRPPGPHDRRLRRQRPGLALHPDRTEHLRARAGARRGLVRAVPEPLDRRPRVRRGRLPVRLGRRRRVSSSMRTTGSSAAARAARRRANPCGDPPGGLGVANTSPTARGGALRTQSLRRPERRADQPRRDDHPDRPGHGRRGAGQPAVPDTRTRTSGGSSPTASATRSGSSFRPGTNELWIGDVGWNDTEEINRLADPGVRPGGELRLAVLRGLRRRTPATTALTQCIDLYADSRRRPSASRASRTRTAARSSRATAARRHQRRHLRRRVLRGRRRTRLGSTTRCSSPTTAATASGRWARRTGCPIRRSSRSWSATPATRSTSRPVPTATSSTSTTRVARSTASRYAAGNTPPVAQISATPVERRRADGRRVRRPNVGRLGPGRHADLRLGLHRRRVGRRDDRRPRASSTTRRTSTPRA